MSAAANRLHLMVPEYDKIPLCICFKSNISPPVITRWLCGSTLFFNPSIVRFAPPDESIKLDGVRVDEQRRKISISSLL